MKLKDILKTNTNKIGWLKVFKKLGADNETMKFVNDNVGKESSGGGSDIKYYYYICDTGFPIDLIETINISIMPITSILIQLNGSDINNIEGVVKTNLSFINDDYKYTLVDNIIVGFSVKDEPSFRTFITPRGYNYEIIKGTLYDRTFTICGDDFADDVVGLNNVEGLRHIAQNFKVTKEEYESLITYKP